MGTAKYDHPGYVADTGDAGKYHVGIWCPHGYPAHIHIGRPADGGDPWRCCACAYRTACSSRWPTIPRRCAGGRSDRRWARACCAPWRWTATTRRSVSNSTPSPGAAPCRRRGPDELPTAVVEKPWDSRCACVNSDVITRAWRRRSISVRSGARSCSPPPCDNRSRRAARGAFCFSHAMIPPRCSVFPCLFRHDCSRAFVARDGRAGRDDERGDGRRQARARGRDRRRSCRPDGGRGSGRPGLQRGCV